MGLVVVTPPAVEPLTLDELRAHLSLDALNAEPSPDAPTVALAAPPAAGAVDAGAHRYRVTFVTADGETDGGTISDAVTVADSAVNGQVALSAIPIGGSLVTARRIYRTIAGGASYFLLATIADNATTTYTDNIADLSLGAAAPATNTTGDPQLASWRTAARLYVEDFLRRSLITTTWRHTLDSFPCDDVLELPRAPLVSVTSIAYVDTAGNTQTLSTDVYDVDTASLPGRIALKYLQIWPYLLPVRNAVTVTFVAGYGASGSAVPAPILAAMKLLIGHWYENREAVTGSAMTELPVGVSALLWPHRNLEAA